MRKNTVYEHSTCKHRYYTYLCFQSPFCFSFARTHLHLPHVTLLRVFLTALFSFEIPVGYSPHTRLRDRGWDRPSRAAGRPRLAPGSALPPLVRFVSPSHTVSASLSSMVRSYTHLTCLRRTEGSGLERSEYPFKASSEQLKVGPINA